MVTAPTLGEVRELLDEIVDPEISALTIADLGVLRGVARDEDGTLRVTVTPTYSGCPAMDLIRSQIASVLEAAGVERFEVETVYSPAWTTDWMTPDARRKLEETGIAPPSSGPVLCPQCRSESTHVVSPFGSTACKALMVCDSCGEPFDLFKEH